MKHPLPPLDGLKAFEAAARHLSFSLAADELCITKGAISYQIRKLEQHLQCALFKRSIRQVYLTDAGQMLLQSTQILFSDLGEALDRIHGETRNTGVTIAVTTYVAARWLSQHISAFNAHHRDVTILLQHTVNSADFKLTEVDLAIRWGPCRAKPERNRIGEIPMPLYPAASPDLLQRHGINAETPIPARQLSNGPLAELPLLCEDRQQDLWQEWIVASCTGTLERLPSVKNPQRIITDSNVRVQAAIDGQGLILADELMINEIKNGLLVRPFNEQLHGYGYALLCPASRIISDDALALKNWLSKQIEELVPVESNTEPVRGRSRKESGTS